MAKCLGLAKHSYSSRVPLEHVSPNPGLPKALQIQVLPFLSHHSCSSKVQIFPQQQPRADLKVVTLAGITVILGRGCEISDPPLEQQDSAGTFHNSWIQKSEKKLCNSLRVSNTTGTIGSNTKGCCHKARKKKNR